MSDEEKLFSPRATAHILGMSEASVKRWVDKGKIKAIKTLGGHRKISLRNIISFAETTNHEIKNPELIALLPGTGRLKDKISKSHGLLESAFEASNEALVFALLLDLHVSGMPLANIFDQILAPALEQVGCDWESGAISVHYERRIIQMCTRALYSLSKKIKPKMQRDGLVILGTLSGDHYSIPILMAELIILENGYVTMFMGNDLPIENIHQVLDEENCSNLIISHSASYDGDIIATLSDLNSHAQQQQVSFIFGGRLITPDILETLSGHTHLTNMQKLADFFS